MTTSQKIQKLFGKFKAELADSTSDSKQVLPAQVMRTLTNAYTTRSEKNAALQRAKPHVSEQTYKDLQRIAELHNEQMNADNQHSKNIEMRYHSMKTSR